VLIKVLFLKLTRADDLERLEVRQKFRVRPRRLWLSGIARDRRSSFGWLWTLVKLTGRASIW